MRFTSVCRYWWVPCEKLRRATFIPARMSFSIIFSESDAGPIVQTIFVRRIICTPFPKSDHYNRPFCNRRVLVTIKSLVFSGRGQAVSTVAVTRFYDSTIGKKAVMAITGLILFGFLV